MPRTWWNTTRSQFPSKPNIHWNEMSMNWRGRHRLARLVCLASPVFRIVEFTIIEWHVGRNKKDGTAVQLHGRPIDNCDTTTTSGWQICLTVRSRRVGIGHFQWSFSHLSVTTWLHCSRRHGAYDLKKQGWPPSYAKGSGDRIWHMFLDGKVLNDHIDYAQL
jgi:hypothetical protein